jgi:hypothetical protein
MVCNLIWFLSFSILPRLGDRKHKTHWIKIILNNKSWEILYLYNYHGRSYIYIIIRFAWSLLICTNHKPRLHSEKYTRSKFTHIAKVNLHLLWLGANLHPVYNLHICIFTFAYICNCVHMVKFTPGCRFCIYADFAPHE